MATTAAPAKAAASKTAAAEPPVIVVVENPTPEAVAADIDFLFNAQRPSAPEQKEVKEEKPAKETKTETAAEKKVREAKEAEVAVVKVKEGEPKPAPAKRVIRRAPGYVDTPAPGAAVEKLTEAVQKLTDIQDKLSKPGAPQPEELVLQLDEEEQEQIRVLEAMGELDKKKYGHLAENAKKYISELPAAEQEWEKKFQTKWEKNNPESKFDSTEARDTALADALAEGKEEFQVDLRKKYRLDYTEAEFNKGIRYLDTKPMKDKLAAQERELAELRERQKQIDLAPVVKDAGVMAVADFTSNLKNIGEEFEGLLAEDGTLNKEAVEKLDDADVVAPILEVAAARSRRFAEATFLVANGQQAVFKDDNGGNIDLKPAVLAVCDMFEASEMQKPEAARMDNGKAFTTRAQFEKMKPAEREKHWTVDSERLIAFANDEMFKGVKASITAEREAEKVRVERVTKKLGLDPAKLAALRGTKPVAAASTGKEEKPAKPQSPSTSDTPPPNGNGASGEVGEDLLSMSRGRAMPTK